MTTVQSNRNPRILKNATDFSKVGGLSHHIKVLRDTIILPLLHKNVYSHFNIKMPRGVLFYGPPGTGKTLVAGALATELNKEGFGKVSFYKRKAADVLDKWVGESEKKLRTLFETAAKSRPSIIFFDELDGLAPIRSTKNDHVHCSIVTTLLALMDGLDSVPGVIIIGATNRIESVDPALRRTGRFDRELYFPLPSTDAREEILQVHMQTWRNKPSAEFVKQMAELTAGYCGSDLQALCAEALLCAMKRAHPNIQRTLLGTKVKIDAEKLHIEEIDFLSAKKNLTPTSHSIRHKIRKLNPTIEPLLQRQLDLILSRLKMLWPHFFVQFHKYALGTERYIGRLLLVGSNLQGLNAHLIPAILQNLEHLPAFFLDPVNLQNKHLLSNFCKNWPSVLVIPRIDDLWNFFDVYEQNYVATILEDIHSDLPILIIATHEEELPLMLQNFFYNNTSLVIPIENPTQKEVESFFIPMFFGDHFNSLSTIFETSTCNGKPSSSKCDNKKERSLKSFSSKVYGLRESGKVRKRKSIVTINKNMSKILAKNSEGEPNENVLSCDDNESLCTICGTTTRKKQLSLILTELLHSSFRFFLPKSTLNHRNKQWLQSYEDSEDINKQNIFALWKRTVSSTAKDMPIAQLEVLYDTISACISIHKDNFQNLITNLEETLHNIEASK